MPSIAEIRSKYPQYADLSDRQLAEGLHRKFYADIPFADFAGRIGLSEKTTAADLRKQNPGEYDPQSPQFRAKYGPQAVGSGERLAAGAGKAITDLGRGLGQVVGLVSREDVAASRELDAPLMDTVAGKAGAFAGTTATALPAAAIPGANTLTGAALIGGGYGLAQPSTSTTETVGNVALGAAGGAAGQYLGGKLAGYIGNRIAARQAARAAAQAADPRKASLAAGQAAGYVVPPASANRTPANRLIEGVAGKAATQQAAAVRNQQVTNALARAELGLAKDAPITRESLRAVRSQAGKAYEAVKGFGNIAADSQYLDDLVKIGASVDDTLKDFPDINVADDAAVRKLVDGLLKDNFSSGSAVALVKRLRFAANKNLSFLNSADPAKRALGTAQRDAAAAVEELIERNLAGAGQQQLAENFQRARVLIAKSYSVESALNPGTGNVVATNLGRQLKSGKPLSGGLETAANMAASFPKAMVEQLDSPGVSVIDTMAGMALGATVDPTFLAIPAARMGTRAGILSGPYQRALLGAGGDSVLSSLLLTPKLTQAAGIGVPAYVGQQ